MKTKKQTETTPTTNGTHLVSRQMSPSAVASVLIPCKWANKKAVSF